MQIDELRARIEAFEDALLALDTEIGRPGKPRRDLLLKMSQDLAWDFEIIKAAVLGIEPQRDLRGVVYRPQKAPYRRRQKGGTTDAT